MNDKNALVFGVNKTSPSYIEMFVQELSKQTNLVPDLPILPASEVTALEPSYPQDETLILQKQLQLQKEGLELQKQQLESQAKCPRCGSTSLSGDKKGFGIGKAVMGAFVVGPLGLMAGNIGAHKVKVTCLKCGKQFWA